MTAPEGILGTRLSDRYQILTELGRGGMAVVYRARDPLLEREVAVKTIAPGDLRPATVARFEREARVIAQLDHPSIVPIYDFGHHRELLFFVMPLLSGETLQALMRDGDLELAETLEICAQVAEALDYAACQGVVHRDVKPENVMVRRRPGERPRVWVMDFGLALGAAGDRGLGDRRITKTGKLPGTLAYLSPEQVLSEPADGRSDLYSLATILYECLAGRTPFSGAPGAVLYRIVHDPPPPLADEGVDERLAEIVHRALAKDPAERPERGRELAALFRNHALTLSAGDGSASKPAHPRPPLRPPRPPLVGRDAELAEVERRLERAVAGHCQLVLLGGETGMGKTRLLEELEERAATRGLPVLWGRFSELERSFPFQGFGELILDFFRSRERIGGGAPPDLHDLAADLLILFPTLGEVPELRAGTAAGEAPEPAPGPPAGAADDADRIRLFETVARTLIRLAGDGPLILLLENLHAAGASLELLRFVVRRLALTPTLVVGTYRRSEVGRRHPLARLMRGFEGDPSACSMTLGPLGAAEHRKLMAVLFGSAPVSDALVEKLHQASEGNPFFACELVRTLTDSGDVAADGSGEWTLSSEDWLTAGRLPDTIQEVVETRLERLPEEERRILGVASVLGRSFEFRDLQGLVEDPEAADLAVDRLIREGLLEEDPHGLGDRLTFRSGVVREALYGALPRRRRRTLHRRHARRLEERNAGRPDRVAAELVHHFAAGDAVGKTIDYALRHARRSLLAGAWEEVVRAVRTALEFVEDDGFDPVSVTASNSPEGELRHLLACASSASGEVESARREVRRAVAAYQRAGDRRGAAASSLLAAETAWRDRRVGETRRWVEKGIAFARAGDDRQSLRKLLMLAATVSNLRGEYRRGRILLEEAQELPDPGAPAEGGAVPSGQTLVTMLSQSITTLDPAEVQTAEDTEVLANVFEPLLRTDPDGNLLPCLCQAWEGSPDAREFRFTLRGGVRFSDGEQLTAAGVKRSTERAFRRGAGGLARSAFSSLLGWDDFLAGRCREVAGIEVLGELELGFRLTAPLPVFPTLLTGMATAVARRIGDSPLPLGTGPFQLRSHRRDRVMLERHTGCWSGAPRVDRLEFRTAGDAADIATALRAGEIDIARELRPEDLEGLTRDDRFRSGLVETARKNVYLVLMNAAGPAARHPEVRRVLAAGVRTPDVVWTTLGRFAQPATGLIPPGVLGHVPEERSDGFGAAAGPKLSAEAARSLLAEAGCETPLRLRGAAHPFFADRYRALTDELLLGWQRLGMEVELEDDSMDAYLERLDDPRGLDLLIVRWAPEYDDPDSFVYLLFHSRMGIFHRQLPTTDLDPLLDRARQERRPAVRRALYWRIEKALSDHCSLVPLFHDVDYRIASPLVHGLRLQRTPPYVNYAELGKAPATPQIGHRPFPARGELRVALAADLGGLDPAGAFFVERAESLPNVFEPLTRIADGAEIVPHLASEVTAEEGGQRFRIRLPDEVSFHDGRRLTSRDVRYTFERLLRAPRIESAAALLLLRGAAAFRRRETDRLPGLEVTSEHLIELELEVPTPFFPARLTHPVTGIVPEGTERFDGDWRQGVVGTGPFRVIDYRPGDRLELAANPRYRRPGYPRCDRLVFELDRSPEEVLAGFRSGRLTLASHLRPEDVEQLRRDPELAAGYRELPGLSIYYLAFNTRVGPLADPRTRGALARCLDPEIGGVVERALGRLGVRAFGFIPPGLLGHPETPSTLFGPPTAEDRNRLRGLELKAVLHPTYLGQHAPVWNELRQVFAGLGVELRVEGRGSTELLRAIQDGTTDFMPGRWIADYPDADAFVHPFHSREGFYAGMYENPEVDRLIEVGRQVGEARERERIYRWIESLLARESFLLPLFHEQIYRFVRPGVAGLRLGFRMPEVAYEELHLTA